MANARIRTTVEISEQTDYYNPRVKEAFEETSSPDEVQTLEIQADVAGTVVELGTFDLASGVDGVADLIVYNEDPTNFALGFCYIQHGTVQTYTNVLDFADAATGDTITRGGAEGTAFNNTAFDLDTGQYVRVTGADTAANNGIFLVASRTEFAITMATSVALTAETDAGGAVTLQSLGICYFRIDPGTCIKLQRVHGAGDLTLRGNTAAVNCRVVVLGT